METSPDIFRGGFNDSGNSLEIINNDNFIPVKLQVNDVASNNFNGDEDFKNCRDLKMLKIGSQVSFSNEPNNAEKSTNDNIFKLDTLFKNFKELLVSEKPRKSVSESIELQSGFGQVNGLESENDNLTEDETENCILEHKSIKTPKVIKDFNPTRNSFSVLNTLTYLDKKIEMLKENKNRSELNDDSCEKSEKRTFWIENGSTEGLDFSRSKEKASACKNVFEGESEPSQIRDLDLSKHLPLSKTLKIAPLTTTNLTTKELNKLDFPCELMKPCNNSDENKNEGSTTTSLKVLESDNILKIKIFTNHKSDKDVENNALKLTEEHFSSEKVFAVVDNVEVDIHEAVRSGDESLVLQLLASGVDPNEPDWGGKGDPPIVQAALKQNISIVGALCEAGCDVNLTSVRGETALHMVVSRRPVNLPLLNTLLAAGCDANVQDKLRGCSALHCVSGFADDEPAVFRRLVAVTNVNLRDHRHCTVLHRVAATSGDVAWIRQLLELGADPNVQNDRGETALCVALERGWTEGALALVAGGTELSRTNLYRETALHVAARHDQATVVAALLRHNADVNGQDLAGNTALHLAAGRGYVDTVRQLLSCPSLDLDTHNGDNATPLTCAVESGFISVVQMLVQAEQVDLQPALDVAKQGYRRLSQPEMCQLLTKELARRKTSTDLSR